MKIEQYIKKIIHSENSITVENLMSIVMASNYNSYYRIQHPLGKDGDFITAPEISQMFGEMIGIWCVDLWYKLNSPKKIHLVELGPGTGTLLRDILNATKHIKKFSNSINLTLVEINPNLKKIQNNVLLSFNVPIKWVKSVNHIVSNYPTIILANEFFDALPIKQYIKDINQLSGQIKWSERVIKIDSNNKFYFDTLKVNFKENKFLNLHCNAPSGGILETSPSQHQIMKTISKLLKKNGGGCLIIDYGYDFPPEKRKNYQYNSSLQAIKNHQYYPLLENLGFADLSAHVDFWSLKDTAFAENLAVFGSVSQNFLLHKLGIKSRVNMLKQMNLTPNLALKLDLQYDRLTSIHAMGELFKAISVTSDPAIIPLGFL
ncbi:S-adenosyl-L-methionine-dependent methyltransferase family protein [Orientia chuto str. Dubai]|uniref:S-adenosyl-L-methionine-dependent methyltransferase family protein n=1 Tax=Orientia chuto str. Dubai TaxID=1359168 RepID=A0A0F3MLL1_9RICK|nr:SAM-dependent methyltransferase [Candidatus Orientia mediorientalis]KJV55499.1 S-adenosyl-L-methionine-dependent methyltransferase family protein [Orientia chuto str. Dubai]